MVVFGGSTSAVGLGRLVWVATLGASMRITLGDAVGGTLGDTVGNTLGSALEITLGNVLGGILGAGAGVGGTPMGPGQLWEPRLGAARDGR